MTFQYASRMRKTQRSFIREILKVTEDNNIISFAGGLPSPALFPVEAVSDAARDVLSCDGSGVLQYSTTEGYRPLREFIARRYQSRFGLAVSPDQVLITNGSQQCLDLLGKVMIDPGDTVVMEKPGYLGAIQAFSLYEPGFQQVALREDGPDADQLRGIIRTGSPKIMYGVPNFQNPSGTSYSKESRQTVAGILKGTSTLFVEDDAYGELRFRGEDIPPVYGMIPEQAVLCGSFSKIIAPGMRMGWMVASPEIYSHLVTVKQASDLHSNYLTQRIISRFLECYDIDRHISRIRGVYRHQRDLMVSVIEETFPPSVSFTRPEGGMFLWVTLPPGCNVMDLFELAIKENVAFVPGLPFYTDGGGSDTMRLNYTNSDDEQIVEGITRLSKAVAKLTG
jgi:2-aminoadipate transaminase